jgi:hypothetical protein
MAFKKIQDGVRLDFSFLKSIEREIVLYKSLIFTNIDTEKICISVEKYHKAITTKSNSQFTRKQK